MADIELVIKIPEEMYNDIQSCDWKNGERWFSEEWKAIHNGTPLPKGHGDLIDVNRKITVPIYDEQYEEWGEETLTVLEALNKWSDEGVRVEDIIIPADEEFKEREQAEAEDQEWGTMEERMGILTESEGNNEQR